MAVPECVIVIHSYYPVCFVFSQFIKVTHGLIMFVVRPGFYVCLY